MLLAFDVGNTNIVLGLYKEGKLVANWRLTTDKNKTADELGITVVMLFKYENFDIKDVDDVIISSVVPQIMYSLQHMAQKYCGKEAIVIGPGIRTGLNIKYDNPKLVGADRIVNAVAAMKKYGGAVIIVDFGTATTFCAITEKSEYLGGAILPGVKISSDALYEKTAKLPRVELVKPESVIAKNTIQSIQSGLIYGYAGAVERLVSKMKSEIVSEKPVRVIATGGLASLIATEAESIDIVDKNLTLDGLYYIYEMNRS